MVGYDAAHAGMVIKFDDELANVLEGEPGDAFGFVQKKDNNDIDLLYYQFSENELEIRTEFMDEEIWDEEFSEYASESSKQHFIHYIFTIKGELNIEYG